MKFEQQDNFESANIKRFFSKESLVYDEAGNVKEIRLPDLHGEESMRLVRELEKIGVILSVVSIKDETLELALKTPKAIKIMLEKVINIKTETTPGFDNNIHRPTAVVQEWSAEKLESIDEKHRTQQPVENVFDEVYQDDVLDLMERGAILFYQGIDEDEKVMLHKSPQFSTDGKIIKQKYQWENGQLFTKGGIAVSAREHKAIIEAAKNSDEALATACQIHEGLVRWVANEEKFKLGQSVDHIVDMDDLLQAGREELIKAIRRYQFQDEESEKISTTYFVECIRGGMLRALSRDRGGKVVHLPTHVIPDLKAVRKEIERQREVLDFDGPDLEELRKNTNFDIKKVRDLYQIIQQIPEEYDDENPEHQEDNYRPDEHLHEDDPNFGDQFENYTKKNLKEVMDKILLSLTPRQERVIRLRFFHEKTLGEVGQELGITVNRVAQIEAKALRGLKRPLRSKGLRSFL